MQCLNRAVLVIVVFVLLSAAVSAQQSSFSQFTPYTGTLSAQGGQWSIPVKDFANLRSRPLDEINSSNMAAWLLGTTVAWAQQRADEIRSDNFFSAWSWQLPVLAGLIFSAVLYLIGVTRLRRRSPERTFAQWRVFCLLSGWLVLMLVLLSPLHEIRGALFSAHMAQDQLLMMIAAPLLVLARPLLPMLIAMPPRARLFLGAHARGSRFDSTWAAVTNPITSWLIYGVTLWIWHVPALYEMTMQSENVRALQETCFLLSALLFWWTLIHRRYTRMRYGAAVIYVFTTAIHSGVLGALFTFSSRLWHPAYLGHTSGWHLAAIHDQQLGGLIMTVAAGAVLIGTSVGLLATMLRESERPASYSILAEVRHQAAGRSL